MDFDFPLFDIVFDILSPRNFRGRAAHIPTQQESKQNSCQILVSVRPETPVFNGNRLMFRDSGIAG